MIWKIIPGFTKYAVSEFGEIKRLASPYRNRGKRLLPERLLKLSPSGPYLAVKVLRDVDEKFVTKRVHVLVALAFHGKHPKNKPWALHSNDKKHDNRPQNVYWGCPELNAKDMKRNGISTAKLGHGRAAGLLNPRGGGSSPLPSAN